MSRAARQAALASLLLAFLGVLLSSPSARATEFLPGQVWEYKTRPTEADSTLTVLKVDTVNNQRIIHVAVHGLRMKRATHMTVGARRTAIAELDIGDSIGHMPIAEQTLAESVTRVVRVEDKLPPFQEGYDLWKAAFDKGEGGYFTIPVAKCVEFVEQTLN